MRRCLLLLFAVLLLAPAAAHAGLRFTYSEIPLGAVPRTLATGDFDGDGIVDLAVDDAGTFGILRGAGDGTFSLSHPAPDVKAQSLVAGDFDQDGRSDLAIATPDGISVQRSSGAGTRYATAPFGFDDLATGDTNGDGHLDLVAMTEAGVVVLIGDGTGAFAVQAPVDLKATEDDYFPGPYGKLAVGDVDGDGRDDVIAVSELRLELAVLPGAADGTLGAPRFYLSPVRSPRTLSVRRINGDARADIVMSNPVVVGGYFQQRIFVALAGEGGTFFASQAIPLDLGQEGVGIFGPPVAGVGDLNGDGIQDLVGTAFDKTVQYFLGHGDGTFGAPVDIHEHTEYGKPVIVDLNRDGRNDIVFGGLATRVVVALNQGLAPEPPPVAPKAVKTPLKVKLAVPTQRLQTVVRNGLKLTIGCSQSCSLKAQIVGRSLAKTVRMTRAGTRTVRLPLTKRAQRSLRGRERADLKLRIRPTEGEVIARTVALRGPR